MRSGEVRRFKNEDLVLEVSRSVDRSKWNEGRYEAFLDLLCQDREYQKEAIRTALRYMLGGEYTSLRDLARKSYDLSTILEHRYGSFESMARHLQLPTQLSASLDLATGTGKSYVMYGLAAIMLAEGVVDRCLVLCPSTTIESGLIDKFRALASDVELAEALPEDARLRIPRIIKADETIVEGAICVENYHATLERTGSSIRDGLWGKGSTTLILNDEAHHVANQGSEVKRWKEFLQDPAFGFRFVIGVSGTCYVGNDYFADVIYRFSLRQAMDAGVVKLVEYVDDGPQVKNADERWQVILNRHDDTKSRIKRQNVLPLSIVVTDTVARCKTLGEELRAQVKERYGLSSDDAAARVLVVHSGAEDNRRLPYLDLASNTVEWVVSVSMLTEGWDVARVFQIVPHEERAFDSKLLISQVLGRGLRRPKGMEVQPTVTVFNHEAWAGRIRQLVNEVLEIEKRLTSRVVPDSAYHFSLQQIDYEPEAATVTKPMEGPYTLFENGVALPTVLPEEAREFMLERARTGEQHAWQTVVRHKTFTPREVALRLYERLEEAYDPESEDPNLQHRYTDDWPVERLERMVSESLASASMEVATEGAVQRFLAAMGTLRRRSSQNVRYAMKPQPVRLLGTEEKPTETVSASELTKDKTLFYTEGTADTLSGDQREFFDELAEGGTGYKAISVPDRHSFKTPVNLVIADHEPEKKFVRELVRGENAAVIDAWVKSTSARFYEIEYTMAKGSHTKRSTFSPDFFLKLGDRILVVEIKGDEERREPSDENRRKNEAAVRHFELLNQKLAEGGMPTRYHFNFLSPSNFGTFFQTVRQGDPERFRSELDVALTEPRTVGYVG